MRLDQDRNHNKNQDQDQDRGQEPTPATSPASTAPSTPTRKTEKSPKGAKQARVGTIQHQHTEDRRLAVVVDGSNMAHATQRGAPPSHGSSLHQLMALVVELRANPELKGAQLLVVVDANFRHVLRISPGSSPILEKELEAFRTCLLENGDQFIDTPAGIRGRGDDFLLQIASKRDAVVVSNDSFQEFHSEYPFLFHDGRLYGGKFVTGMGWVLTKRAPSGQRRPPHAIVTTYSLASGVSRITSSSPTTTTSSSSSNSKAVMTTQCSIPTVAGGPAEGGCPKQTEAQMRAAAKQEKRLTKKQAAKLALKAAKAAAKAKVTKREEEEEQTTEEETEEIEEDVEFEKQMAAYEIFFRSIFDLLKDGPRSTKIRIHAFLAWDGVKDSVTSGRICADDLKDVIAAIAGTKLALAFEEFRDVLLMIDPMVLIPPESADDEVIPAVTIVTLQVKSLDGVEISLQVAATAVVWDVKVQLQQHEGLPPAELQRLTFRGQQLEDAVYLGNYSVKDQDTLLCFKRMQGAVGNEALVSSSESSLPQVEKEEEERGGGKHKLRKEVTNDVTREERQLKAEKLRKLKNRKKKQQAVLLDKKSTLGTTSESLVPRMTMNVVDVSTYHVMK